MVKTIRSVRLNVLLQLAIAVIFALSALIIVLLVSHNMRQQALKEAEAKARIILDRNLATHHYFTQELKPDIFEWTDSFRSPEYFSPAWMSSTYAVRAIDNFFKQLTDADYYYKEAAIDARMPANEADEYEATFLNKLSEEPNTLIESEIRTIAGKPYYVLLRRGEMMEESCLRCHSEPDAAPAGLIDYYGPDRSFQRAVGETVSAISIRIPLDEAYANARNVTTTLSTLLLMVLGLLFLAQYVLNKHFVFAPLNHIRQRAREIAEDERHLGEQMPVPIGRELADLTTTFNVMSSTLLRDREDLENRVQERTEELDNLNYQLREDIEKRIRVEAALRTSEEKYRSLYTSMSEGLALHKMLFDETGNPIDYVILEVNPAFEELTGISAQDCAGRRASEIFGTGSAPYLQEYAAVVRTGHPFSFEVCFSPMNRHFRISAFSPEAGQFVTVFMDISDRKQAEEALAAEKEHLAVTLRSIGDGVITTDVHGKVVMLNHIAEELTGWSNVEAANRPLSQVMPLVDEQTNEPITNPVDLVLQTGETVGLSNHTALVDKDGVKRLIADSAAPIKDGEGNTAGVVMVFRDVTQQRIMEEELLKAQKLESVGILAGGIAHDFNNLLTGVLGNIALAKMLTHPTEEVFQILDEAERASKRAAELTKQLLTFSKGGAPVKKMTQLDEMIVDTTRFALRGSRVKAVFRIAPDLYPMNADEGQISQVIHNMVLNASQAMPEGGVIEIVAKNVDAETSRNLSLPPESHVAIAIRDQGPGIPNALQDKIFDPYFTTKENGSGLGLAAAYSIVRNHDGQIRLKSTEGHGSTFTVYLPATVVAATVSPVSSKHLSHGSGRILVMDDENMVRIVAQRILTQLGYEVICVSDGVEAIESYQRARARNEPFDLIIMDLTIPGGMGGKEAIVKLRIIDPAVQAIVASGYSNDPVLADYARFGFQGVVSKPYTISDLGETVHAVLPRKDDSS